MSQVYPDIWRNEVTLPTHELDTSDLVDMTDMFWWCGALKNIDLSGFRTEKVETTINMFNGCGALEKLDLSSFRTPNLVNMLNMFYYCGSLTSLNVSNFNTAKVVNMTRTFASCGSLTSLDLTSFDFSNVVTMTELFADCRNLTEIKGIIDMKSCRNFGDMFKNCPKLKNVKIKNPPNGFFESCHLLTSQYEVVE